MSDRFQVMPPLADDEYASLRDDIAANGVLVPVEYDEDGNILDGHHRVRACEELGLTDWPTVTRYLPDEDDRRRHARRLNLARRHLSRAQRRELIADEITADPDRSNREIGRLLGVDHKTVGSVRRELAGEVPHHDETSTEREIATMLYEVVVQRYTDEPSDRWAAGLQTADTLLDWSAGAGPNLLWIALAVPPLWRSDADAEVWELLAMLLEPIARNGLLEIEDRGRGELPGAELARLLMAVWSSDADRALKWSMQQAMRDQFALAVADAERLTVREVAV